MFSKTPMPMVTIPASAVVMPASQPPMIVLVPPTPDGLQMSESVLEWTPPRLFFYVPNICACYYLVYIYNELYMNPEGALQLSDSESQEPEEWSKCP